MLSSTALGAFAANTPDDGEAAGARRALDASSSVQDTPPAVVAAEFLHQVFPQGISYTFSENVQASLEPQDLEVTSLTTGATFAASSLTYDGDANAAAFGLDSLPNGNYRASLAAASVADASGTTMASGHVLDFFVLTGDINRDRAVNGSDFAILAGNFGKSGRSFGQGDVNADGAVNGSDFALLAGNFGKTVPAVTVLYDSGGFEAPRFVAGQGLQGQDAGTGRWVTDNSSSSSGVLTTASAGHGAQSVQVTRSASPAGDTRWWVPLTAAPSQSLVHIDVDISVAQSTGLTFGPAFGIEAYDASDPQGPKLIGSLMVDAATGDVLYQQAGTGFLTETGAVVARGGYHHYRLSVDFAQKTYSVSVDGNVLRTEGFVDATAAALTDAPITTLAATADSTATATGTAFFDGYRIVHAQAPAAASSRVANASIAGNVAANSPRIPYAPPSATSHLATVAGGAELPSAPPPAVAAPPPARPAHARSTRGRGVAHRSHPISTLSLATRTGRESAGSRLPFSGPDAEST